MSLPLMVTATVTAVVIAVLSNAIAFALNPPPPTGDADLDAATNMVTGSPIAMAGFYIAIYYATVFLAQRVGTTFGGRGAPREVAAAITGVMVISMALTIVESALFILSPGLAQLFALFSFFWLFWILGVFLSEAHGFDSVPVVMAGIFATTFVTIVAVSFVFMIFGLGA
ncbi:MAG: hypothetical protein ACPGID_06125 [Rubricella sp.]